MTSDNGNSRHLKHAENTGSLRGGTLSRMSSNVIIAEAFDGTSHLRKLSDLRMQERTRQV